jgi:hypothetical protein
MGKGSLQTHLPTVKEEIPAPQLVGRTFLMPEAEDGSRIRAKIVAVVNDHKDKTRTNEEWLKIKIGDQEDIVTYNDIINYIEDDESFTEERLWKFRSIVAHKNVSPHDEGYKGCSVNLLVDWEDGSKTWEPLHTKKGSNWTGGIWNDDEVTVAIYAREHDLLDEPGWKLPRLKKLARRTKTLTRLANQAKLQSFRHKPVYMFGYQVPRNHEQAMELDEENGNDKWRQSEIIELGQLDEYGTFQDKGKGYQPGKDYKKINVHLVYAVKHDGRHKCRCVAGGHLTDTPIDSVYSSVVSLRGVRILTFIAELNNLDVWCTDIGNAYLESYTNEKVYIIGGAEFGDRHGHTLIIVKALYGLKSSGRRWHERLGEVMRSMGWERSKAEPDIWMKNVGELWEYVGVYVDDLIIASKNPQEILDILTDTHHFKLKGSGPISYHLGCEYFRDADGVLCYTPRRYIENMMSQYERLYGHLPKHYDAPLTPGDHPEIDTSVLLDLEGTQVYQSLVGCLQWIIQIGRLDITTHVMTLSRFRVAPRVGHLLRVK